MLSPPVAQFADGLTRWQERLDADEWYFARLREELVGRLSPDQAFELVDDVVALLLRQRDEFPCSECGALLLALARRADTSELPPGLENQWDRVVDKLAADSQILEELRRWYRRPAA